MHKVKKIIFVQINELKLRIFAVKLIAKFDFAFRLLRPRDCFLCHSLNRLAFDYWKSNHKRF